MRLPASVYDKDEIFKSLAWVKEMANRENDAVLAVHEPKIKAQIIEF